MDIDDPDGPTIVDWMDVEDWEEPSDETRDGRGQALDERPGQAHDDPDPLTGWRRLRRFTPRIDRLTLRVEVVDG